MIKAADWEIERPLSKESRVETLPCGVMGKNYFGHEAVQEKINQIVRVVVRVTTHRHIAMIIYDMVNQHLLGSVVDMIEIPDEMF